MLIRYIIVLQCLGLVLLFAQWEPDRRLTYDGSVSQTSANSGWCVAAQDSVVHVVWFDYRDGGDKIYYRRSMDNGVSWGPEIKLIDTAAYYPGAPIVSLAISPPQTVHIVWCDYIRNGDDEIFYKRSTDGGTTWFSDKRLTTDDHMVEADSWPSAAASGQNIHVVWHDYKWDGSRFNWDIFYTRSTDGGATWEPEQRLTSYPRMTGPPSVAAVDSLVHIVWYDLGSGSADIYYKRSTNNGMTWSPETNLDNNPASSYMPSIAASGMNVHVVWYDNRDGNYEVYYKRSTDCGVSWSADIRLTNDPAESNRASITASGQNLHVVWFDQRDGNYEIYYKGSMDNGTTWSPDTALTLDPSASFYASVTNAGNVVHVVWTDERDGNREVYYKRNPTGNTGTREYGGEKNKTSVTIIAKPNPFIFFTTVLGHENETFTVYDVAGKKSGVYKGDCIGLDLPAGVYFCISHTANAVPFSVVKVK